MDVFDKLELIIIAVGFTVLYVEFDCMVFSSIGNPKEKPLCVAFRIGVILHDQVVFLVRYLLG